MTPTRPPAPDEIAAEADYFELFGAAIRGWQPRRGYRFSVDALLLAMSAFDAPGGTALELGSGVGVVLLALARNPRFQRLVGLEIQPEMAAFARHNAALNRRPGEPAERLRILQGDLRAPPDELVHQRFDVVVSNPPYYPVASGHVNPDDSRAIARHELTCRLEDVLARLAASLADEGHGFLVYPAPRADAVLLSAPPLGLAVTRLRFVRSRPEHPPRQVLFELRQSSSPATKPSEHAPDLVLHDERGEHTGELADFLRRLERLARL